jgi:arginine-tRNA-protein transferase
METLFRFVPPPSPCGYLPSRSWQLEYEQVAQLTAAEYEQRLQEGWRRFGLMLFRPQCPACTACQSLRVLVDCFRPRRSQRRVQRANEGIVRVEIAAPRVNRAKLQLYDRYHAFQTALKGWPQHPARDPDTYLDSFVNNPFSVQEWCYYLGRNLVGVGYVDDMPTSLSAIYFYYDPEERHRCLGTWNVLRIIQEAQARDLPHVYLGYFVAGCSSLEYKANFVPNEVLGSDGVWLPFRT